MIILFQATKNLIEIPFTELADSPVTFLSSINEVFFVLKGGEEVINKIEYATNCSSQGKRNLHDIFLLTVKV